MLKITVSGEEFWDEEREEFVPALEPVELTLEHSLVSLSKWESKWHKPYLSGNLNDEEARDYIRCMCLDENVPDEVFTRISKENMDAVADYIADPMTATWFTEDKVNGGPKKKGRLRGEVVTAEILYYQMITAQIPVEFERWHLNRLITLIRVIGEKNNPSQKKMSKADITRQYAQLNAARRAKLGTKG